MTLEIQNPAMLALLAVLPGVWWVSRRTLTDFGRWQVRVMAVLRSLIVVMLVLGLAGVQVTRPTSRTAVAVVTDVSTSVSEEGLAAGGVLADDIRERAGGPVLNVVFDNAPQMAPLPRSPRDQTRPRRPATDVARALRFAQASLPAGYVGRVVLVSDGHETCGDMLDAAGVLKARGTELFVLSVPPGKGPEVIVTGIELPGSPTPGGTAEIVTHVLSSGEADGSLDLFVDGFRLGEPRPVRLKPGENLLTAAVRLPKSGSHEYAVRLTSAADTSDGNNRASQVIVLPQELKVLVIEERDEDAKYLVRALRDAGLAAEVRTAAGFPTDIVDLDRYACVVFSDVPATSFHPTQLRMLKSYVEHLGGAFVMVGGEDSFGLGGYFRTPVEEILPVRLDVEKKKEQPTLAMMFVLDKSGSMQGKKVQLAKEAAIATLDLMGKDDLVGVVTFDTKGYMVSPITRSGDRQEITATIAEISAGGGTSMYPALELAFEELGRAQARVKHVIVLTDGKTHDADFAGLVRRMARDRITVSCVAVGAEADTVLLQNVARWGRGRFYFTRDAMSVPQIFARETVTASRSAVVEEPFRPRVVRDVEAVRGIDFTRAPYLLGHVSTRPKPLSEVILVSERAEPVLVRWRFGLGKTVAFTSDVKNRWSAEWLSWPGFGKFWAQLIRDTMRTGASGTAELALRFDGDEAEVRLDALDVAGRFRSRLNVTASVVTPAGEVFSVRLPEVAPGRYRGTFRAGASGTYVVSAALERGGGAEGAGETVVVGRTKPEAAEFLSLDVNTARLVQLAEQAGGEFLDADAWTGPRETTAAVATRLTTPSSRHVWVKESLRPILLWVALVLFLVDLVCRRVDFRPSALLGAVSPSKGLRATVRPLPVEGLRPAGGSTPPGGAA